MVFQASISRVNYEFETPDAAKGEASRLFAFCPTTWRANPPTSYHRRPIPPSTILVSPWILRLTARLNFGRKQATLRGDGAYMHVRRLLRRACGAGHVSAPGGLGDRKPRAEAASHGAETSATTPTARRCRPRVLGRPATLVVWVDESPAHRQPGDRGPVAPGSVSPDLGDDLPTSAAGATSHRW